MFNALGCDLWCTDFAPLMIDQAKIKLPRARFFLHDLREPLPAELNRRFDVIVSAYVFHHFELDHKVNICRDLIDQHLNPSGRLIIADLSFPTFADKEKFKLTIRDWEEEFYWYADESLAALKFAGMNVEYVQVSPCAGVYRIW
jgi:putative AdoMet-dependent methyltransferase